MRQANAERRLSRRASLLMAVSGLDSAAGRAYLRCR